MKFFIPFTVVGLFMIFGMLSCTDDLNNVGENLPENNVFQTGVYTANIKAYNRNIEKNRTDLSELSVNTLLLGIQHSEVSGLFTASIASRLSLPDNVEDFGVEPSIDRVYLHIPFKTSVDGTYDDGKPKFSFQDVWREGNGNFQLKIHRLATYLNLLDPENPMKKKAYYSDEELLLSDELFSGTVTPSLTDTMLVIPRYKLPNYPDPAGAEVYLHDTIKEQGTVPSLNIPLDSLYFKENFLDLINGSEFASQSNFDYYFRGLLIEALEDTPGDASLMKLDMSQMRLDIYYSSKQVVDEDENQDLNDNGITGETGVYVQYPGVKHFFLSGVRFNTYNRDYANSEIEPYLNAPDNASGEDLLWVEGAAGSVAELEIFGDDADDNGFPDELDTLRNKNWLVNDAQILLYVEDMPGDEVPALMLYAASEDAEEEGDYIYKAYELGGPVASLEKDDEDQPLLYRFHITDLITEMLSDNPGITWKNLRVKTYESDTDIINSAMNEKPVSEYSFDNKGVKLFGNEADDTDKRVKLIIYYTEKQ